MTNSTATQSEYLPWETSTGFLWGFPATFWLLFSRPHKAFSLKPIIQPENIVDSSPINHEFTIPFIGKFTNRYVWSELFKPILFFALFMFICSLAMACFHWGSIFIFKGGMAEMQKGINSSGIALFEWNIYRLGLILITGPLREGIILLISAIIVCLFGVILRVDNIDVILIYRVLLYAIVSNVLLLIPVIGSFLMLVYLLVFIAIGILKSQNVGWIVAAVLSIVATATIFFSRTLLRPMFDKVDTETIMYFLG